MITSYVTPDGDLLYLSLIGRLDGEAADEILGEYHVRFAAPVRRCILDLATAESATERGLAVLDRLARLSRVDGVELSLVARGSAVEGELAETARGQGVPVVDGGGLHSGGGFVAHR
jgi:anti-anti-sigma regulatory factor